MSGTKQVCLADVAPITWGGQEAARFLLRARDTGGRYSFYEVSVPAGEGSLLHLHEDMDEAFYVTDGEFEIKIDGAVYRAPAGTLVFGPRGVAHSFYNTWPRPSTMLCISSPGGIEDFFEDLSRLLAADEPPGWDRMRQLALRHRIIAHPPEGELASRRDYASVR